MCAAAIEQSSWLMVDPFETSVRNSKGEPQYVPTARVLAHVDHEINDVLGGVSGKRARICLLAGSDLVSRIAYSSRLTRKGIYSHTSQDPNHEHPEFVVLCRPRHHSGPLWLLYYRALRSVLQLLPPAS